MTWVRPATRSTSTFTARLTPRKPELAYERAALLGISKVVVASETGLSALEVLELICKPRRARHAWPVDQRDWVGDLYKYRRFTI